MKSTSHHSPANVRRHARKAEAEYALMGMEAPAKALAAGARGWTSPGVVGQGGDVGSDGDAQRFLDRVRDSRRVAAPTVGRGTYRVLAGDAIGGELEDDGRLVHLCGFPGDDRRGREPRGVEDRLERPVAPPSRRRRMR